MSKGKQLKSKEDIIERFWSYVDKTDDCWNWQATKTNFGHGRFETFKNRQIFNSRLAHRIAYWLIYGEYDTSLNVCHKCDNPLCVNPNHLFLGTRSDNMKDCSDKGRLTSKKAKGENSGRAKLTWEQVREIRELHSKGGVSQRQLGRMFRVDNKTIQAIIQNRTWIEKKL
jgi:hypothetical protein